MTSSPQVLVIDDEVAISDLFVDFLSTIGIRPQVANSGQAALSLIDNQPFQLIFCDLRMPGLCGPPLIKQLKDRRPEAKVVLMTGTVDEDEVDAGLEAGAVSALRKPFKLNEIIEICKTHLTPPA